MSKLAINGGEKVFDKEADIIGWPPKYDDTEKLLCEIYRSAKWSFNGKYERLFDEKFAAYQKAKYGVFMVNGTVTLECALAVFNIGPGDEVIVPAYTWIATGMAPLYLGATPVIVDIEPDTLCMSPEAFEAAITPRTKAVIPVHLYGSMADMDKICAIAKKNNIRVIEDCAHAHGTMWKDKAAGSIGDIGSFSFQESKTMPCGEGGICLTNDEKIFERLDRLAHIGYPREVKQGCKAEPPPMDLLCRNYRATDFQAAILLGHLKRLEEQTLLRDKNAKYITKRLKSVPGISVQKPGKNVTVQGFYVFALLLHFEELKEGTTRAEIIKALNAEGLAIGTGWGAGEPVFEQNLWNIPSDKYRVEDIRVTREYCGKRMITTSLTWLMLSEEDTSLICDAIEKVMAAYRK